MVTRQDGLSAPELADWKASLAQLAAEFDADGLARLDAVAQWRLDGQASAIAWPDALGIAMLVAGLHLDADCVAAVLLLGCDTRDAPLPAEAVVLAQGVERLQDIGGLLAGERRDRRDAQGQAENLRQMLLAMVSDIRVVLIKLAERLHALRRAIQSNDAALQRQLALEMQGLFAPLANRLGVWQIKWEMEDLAFRILDAANYQRIARLLDEKRLDRERYITAVVERLRAELDAAGIRAQVTGRPKHIVSIINKMNRKHLDFEHIYDIRAVRILVDEVRDCYAALGLVHHLWQPIAGEFDDYIAHPKSNDYRSLHTGVVGPESKALEVQIRTHEMHHHAELGVAAHWRYKEGGKSDALVERIAWLRTILSWKDEVAGQNELAGLLRNELFQDRIYVLTPQGRVIDLEAGASPVDFAYHVHTDLGHRCRGAKVDGAIVPLNTPLRNGQRVEILAVRQGGPSRDWLNPALGYLASPRARAKVRHWFRAEYFAEHVAAGRDVLEREQRRTRLADVSHEKLAARLGHARVEDMLAALGRGEIGPQVLADAMRALSQPISPLRDTTKNRPQPPAVTQSVLIEGVAGLPVVLARCCNPAPPAGIVAYATLGRGMTVHRRTCANMLRVDAGRQDRLLAASWSGETQLAPAEILVEAFDRQGLLRDVSALLTREKVFVVRVNTESSGDLAEMHFQVHAHRSLERVLEKIRNLPDVLQAVRLS